MHTCTACCACCGVQTSSECCGTAPALGGVRRSHSHFLDGNIMAPHAWEANPFRLYALTPATFIRLQLNKHRVNSPVSESPYSIAKVIWSQQQLYATWPPGGWGQGIGVGRDGGCSRYRFAGLTRPIGIRLRRLRHGIPEQPLLVPEKGWVTPVQHAGSQEEGGARCALDRECLL